MPPTRQRLERLLDDGSPPPRAGLRHPVPRRAAPRHDLAVVVEGERHRAQLRFHRTSVASNAELLIYLEGSRAKVGTALLHDRMTQTVLRSFDEAAKLFEHVPPRPLQFVSDIKKANRELGLAL